MVKILPEVVNKHRITPQVGDVYIGRGSPWGNQYIIGKHGNRSEVIRKFKEGMTDEQVEQLAEREPIRLVCYCAPQACHGHVLRDALRNYWTSLGYEVRTK